MQNAVPMRAQLGDFELDLKAGELLKNGGTVRLQEQPFQILLMLAERSGELVSRAEIKEKLWPNGVVVEFEHSISTAIKKLRQALQDSAEKPKYVETVARRGYRLVVPLRYLQPKPGDQVSSPFDKPARLVYGHADSNLADSIVVLPFENPHPEMEYLSDGIAETIINRLSQIANLRVVPRSIAFRFKGEAIEPARFRRELNVRLLLTGHVVQQGDNLVVAAELIDTVRESLLWGQTYERKFDDIFSVQDDIGKEVAHHLHFKLTDVEKASLSKRGTESREAYLLHVKAMHYSQKWSPESVRKSLALTQQAIEADPTYAEAYVGLAYMFALMGFFEFAPPAEMFPRSRAAAQKALKIDDSLSNAHAALAFTLLAFDQDMDGAEHEARRAMELGPQSSDGYLLYSHWCLTQCRFEEAILTAKRALELDPIAVPKSCHLGVTYLYARRYTEAIEHLKQTLEIDASYRMVHAVLGLAFARNGNHREALAAAEGCSDDDAGKAILGIVSAITGSQDMARVVLNELRNHGALLPRTAYFIAAIHAELGELDNAFRFLGQALNGRTGQIVYLAADPSFDNLRDDPRWMDLVRHLGLVSI
jgi:TolB-like protein/DNA-binding winged helix-turn-helix (wHTH) protein/tetratricopeptide (TPR) repeat protein